MIGSFAVLPAVPENVFVLYGMVLWAVGLDLERKLRYRSQVCVSFRFGFDFDKKVVQMPS